MNIKLIGLGFAAVATASGAVGCAHDEIKSDGPVKAGDITIAIVDQTCEAVRQVEPDVQGPVGIHVRLKVVNSGDTAVTIHPKRIRLLDDRTGPTEPSQAAASRLIDGGGTAAIDLEFVGEGNLRCPQTPVLSLQNVIEIGNVDIAFPLLSASAPTHGASS